MVVMLLLKRREVKTSKPNIISRMFAGTDHIFHAIFSAVQHGLSFVNKHTFIWLAQWVAYHILSHIREWYIKIRVHAHGNPHTKKVIDMVRGRGEVKDHGASFFLKRISNDARMM